MSAGRLIFCQGWEARQHPWFSRLPWQPVKGEILDLRLRAPALEPWILNAGHWLLPRGDGRFRLSRRFTSRYAMPARPPAKKHTPLTAKANG